MNKARRKTIADIIDRLEAIKSDIELVKEEEQEAYDNMPENLKYGEKAELMESVIEALEFAYDSTEEALDSLQEVE